MNKYLLTIENLFIAKEYDKCYAYLMDLEDRGLYFEAIKMIIEYKLHQTEELDYQNPYLRFYMKKYDGLFKDLFDLRDDPIRWQYLGHLAFHGLGIEQSDERAIGYYKQALAEDIYQTKTYLSRVYKKVNQKSQTLYYLETSLDFILSPHELGLLYQQGFAVEKNEEKAIEYFQKACTLGFDESYYILAINYKEYLISKYGNNYPLELMKKAAKKAHPQALLYMIVDSYQNDYDNYLEWLTKAAVLGDNELKNNIGKLYDEGKELPHNNTQALYWYDLATKAKV